MVVRLKNGVMSGPIPGSSWTQEPGKYPWEQPPQFTDPNEAVNFLWNRMMKKDVFVSILGMLENGTPLTQISDTTLFTGVASGLFTIDVAYIIRDVYISLLLAMCSKAGIKPKIYPDEYKEPGMNALERIMKSAEKEKKNNHIPEGKELDKVIEETKAVGAGLLQKPIAGE